MVNTKLRNISQLFTLFRPKSYIYEYIREAVSFAKAASSGRTHNLFQGPCLQAALAKMALGMGNGRVLTKKRARMWRQVTGI